ncbi:MAG: hypothetical protein IJ708_00155 [Clostridia bacterium]|nr:hypothetical protein [Clostridia bacterium]MBR2288665.1 hypothetical protein [Clostridia bacterium]
MNDFALAALAQSLGIQRTKKETDAEYARRVAFSAAAAWLPALASQDTPKRMASLASETLAKLSPLFPETENLEALIQSALQALCQNGFFLTDESGLLAPPATSLAYGELTLLSSPPFGRIDFVSGACSFSLKTPKKKTDWTLALDLPSTSEDFLVELYMRSEPVTEPLLTLEYLTFGGTHTWYHDARRPPWKGLLLAEGRDMTGKALTCVVYKEEIRRIPAFLEESGLAAYARLQAMRRHPPILEAEKEESLISFLPRAALPLGEERMLSLLTWRRGERYLCDERIWPQLLERLINLGFKEN